MASDFLNNYRNNIEKSNADSQDIADYERFVDNFARTYSEMSGVENNKSLRKKIKMTIMNAGASDGVLSDASSDAEVARYGKDFLNEFGPEGDLSFAGFLKASGDEKALKNWEKYQDYAATHAQKDAEGKKRVEDVNTYAPALGGAVGLGLVPGAPGWALVGAGAGKVAAMGTDAAEGWQKILRDSSGASAFNKSWGKYGNAYSDYYGKTWDLVESMLNDYGDSAKFKKSDVSSPEEKNSESGGNKKEEADDSDTVTFTLSRANDPEYGGFAQKIIDLGLATDKGLWGSDGDVAFYTQQLYDQGALDANGNLKIGTPIKLKRRKV